MLEAKPGQNVPFFIGQQKLLGEIGQNADAVDTLIDHAIENALHALQVKTAVIVERCRGHRPHTAVFQVFGHHGPAAL
jgi:hypothetical protein